MPINLDPKGLQDLWGLSDRYPVRVYRDGDVLEGDERLFQVHGPTCDASDTLPGRVPLPVDVQVGDYLEFGCIGAYSLSGRTDFNGYYSERVVRIEGEGERPPSLSS